MSQCYARLLGNLNITYVTHGKSHEITFVQSYLQTTLIARFESYLGFQQKCQDLLNTWTKKPDLQIGLFSDPVPVTHKFIYKPVCEFLFLWIYGNNSLVGEIQAPYVPW